MLASPAAMGTEGLKAVNRYIAGFPEPVRERLEQVRATIRAAAPDAEEKIAYGIPAFTLHGNLVHFAGFARHIGLYPIPAAIDAFREEPAGYATSKGTVRFPLSDPIPFDLIARMVAFRVAASRARGGRGKASGP